MTGKNYRQNFDFSGLAPGVYKYREYQIIDGQKVYGEEKTLLVPGAEEENPRIPLIKDKGDEEQEYRMTRGRDEKAELEPGSLFYKSVYNEYTKTESLIPYFRCIRTDHNLRYFFELDNITSKSDKYEEIDFSSEKDVKHAGTGEKGYVTFENTTWSNGEDGIWAEGNSPDYDNQNKQSDIDQYQRQMARIGSEYNITQLKDQPEKDTNLSKVYTTPTDTNRTSVKTMASKARYEVKGGLTNGKEGIDIKDSYNFVYSFVKPTRFNLELNRKNYAAFYFRDVRYGLNFGLESGDPARSSYYDLDATYDENEDLYYYRKDDFITYDVPLRVILDRFLPNASLLSSWRLLSNDGTESEETGSVAQDLINDIMQVYNEHSLSGEEMTEKLHLWLLKDVLLNSQEVDKNTTAQGLLENGVAAGQEALSKYYDSGDTNTKFDSYLPLYDTRQDNYLSVFNKNVDQDNKIQKADEQEFDGDLKDEIIDDIKLAFTHYANSSNTKYEETALDELLEEIKGEIEDSAVPDENDIEPKPDIIVYREDSENGGKYYYCEGLGESMSANETIREHYNIPKDATDVEIKVSNTPVKHADVYVNGQLQQHQTEGGDYSSCAVVYVRVSYEIKNGLKSTAVIIHEGENYYGYIIRDKELQKIDDDYNNNYGFAELESGELQATTFKHWQFSATNPKSGDEEEKSYEAWFVDDAFEGLAYDLTVKPHFYVQSYDPGISDLYQDLYSRGVPLIVQLQEKLEKLIVDPEAENPRQYINKFVYNHFIEQYGPEKNHNDEYRDYFTEAHDDWGKKETKDNTLNEGAFSIVRNADSYKQSQNMPDRGPGNVRYDYDFDKDEKSFAEFEQDEKGNLTVQSRKEKYEEKEVSKRVMNASINPEVVNRKMLVRDENAETSTLRPSGEYQDIFGKRPSGENVTDTIGETIITYRDYLMQKKYIDDVNYKGVDKELKLTIDNVQKELEAKQLDILAHSDEEFEMKWHAMMAVFLVNHPDATKVFYHIEYDADGNIICVEDYRMSVWDYLVQYRGVDPDPMSAARNTTQNLVNGLNEFRSRDYCETVLGQWMWSEQESGNPNNEGIQHEVDRNWKIDNEIIVHLDLVFPTRISIAPVSQRVIDRHMPAYFVKSAKYWAGEKEFNNTIIYKGYFDDMDDYKFIVHQNEDAIGVINIDSKYRKVNWRCGLFAPIFGSVRDDNSGREGDIKLILSEWEEISNYAVGAADHAIRDLNSLIQYTKGYDINGTDLGTVVEKKDGTPYVNKDSYSFLYIPEEILDFNELTSERIFWLDRVLCTQNDAIYDSEEGTSSSLNVTNESRMRSKLPTFTWQDVDYDLYPETRKVDSEHSVYSLWPFGGQHSRLLYSIASQVEEAKPTEGKDSWGDSIEIVHDAADLFGRMAATKIYRSVFGDTTQTTDRKMVNGMNGYGYFMYSGDRAAIIAKYSNGDVTLYDRDGNKWGKEIDTSKFVDKKEEGEEESEDAKELKDFDWEWDDLFTVKLKKQGTLGLDEDDKIVHLKLGKNEYNIKGTAAAAYAYEAYRQALLLKDEKGEETERILKEALIREMQWSEIRCVVPGVVSDIGGDAVNGFWVEVSHEKDSEGSSKTIYQHMKRYPMVQKGEYVGAGTILGYEGTTGRTETMHVHFELYTDGERQSNPSEYLYPFFMPFWYPEKAQQVLDGLKNKDVFLDSEYYKTARTVYPYQDDYKMFEKDNTKERVPEKEFSSNPFELKDDRDDSVFPYDEQIPKDQNSQPQPSTIDLEVDESIYKYSDEGNKEWQVEILVDAKESEYKGPGLHTNSMFSSGEFMEQVKENAGRIHGDFHQPLENYGPIAERERQTDHDDWMSSYFNFGYPIYPGDSRYPGGGGGGTFRGPLAPVYPGDEDENGKLPPSDSHIHVADGERAIWEFLVKMFMEKAGATQEYAEYAAAGIIGNMYHETRMDLDPTTVNEIGATGLCQWLGARLWGGEGLYTFCQQNGYDYLSTSGQLAFLEYELSGHYWRLDMNDMVDPGNVQRYADTLLSLEAPLGLTYRSNKERLVYGTTYIWAAEYEVFGNEAWWVAIGMQGNEARGKTAWAVYERNAGTTGSDDGGDNNGRRR